MFTLEQRDALCERVLGPADGDERVVAGALVGSLADDAGDRYPDVDLTFAIADGVDVGVVLDGGTRTLIEDLEAVRLADLTREPTTYRVFLVPDALQLDLSMTPAASFRPAGPRFRLLFGEAKDEPGAPTQTPPVGDLFIATPAVAGDIFGWGVIYALHARACHRARANLAGGALRRRRPRPRAFPRLSAARPTAGAGSRLRRPAGCGLGRVRADTHARTGRPVAPDRARRVRRGPPG